MLTDDQVAAITARAEPNCHHPEIKHSREVCGYCALLAKLAQEAGQ